jgi:hypothetical protein
VVRPYTYSHGTAYGDYTHYRQPIAHPLGANFQEAVGILRYQPLPKLNIIGKLILIKKGIDKPGENWGGNILANNNFSSDVFQRKNLGNSVGQGSVNNVIFASFTASWMLKHNIFIDGTAIIRKSESELAAYNKNSSIASLALRWNIPQRLYEF